MKPGLLNREGRVYSPDGQWAARPGPRNTLEIGRVDSRPDAAYHAKVLVRVVWRNVCKKISQYFWPKKPYHLSQGTRSVSTRRGRGRYRGPDWVLLATYYGLQDGVYRREDERITAIVWRPDGEWIIVASSTGSIHVLTRSALHVRTLRGADSRAATALYLSPEGKLFAYREGETIGVWSL